MTVPPEHPRPARRRRPPPPSPAVIARRRLVVGGGAVLGLGALGLGVREVLADGPATSTAARPTASATTTPSATATASVGASASPTPSPSATATPATAAPTRVEAPRLATRLEDYLDGRGGTLGLELVDLRRGESFEFEAKEGYCYSTIKVLVLTTVLRQAQEADRQLTDREERLARRMITRSDNAATETLLAQVGRDEVRRVADLAGMEHTEIDKGWWGFWRTVPGDLTLMVAAVLSSDAVLDGARRTQARFLMADVVPAQRWGVFAPERDDDDVYVAAKNGWGPLPDGYRLNSTGWVNGGGRDYQLSILSTSPRGFSHGRETISKVARLCHDALGKQLA